MWVKNVGNTGIFVFSSLGVLLHLGRGLCEDSGSVEGLGNDRFATDKYAGKTIFFFSTCLLQIRQVGRKQEFFFPQSGGIASLGRVGRGMCGGLGICGRVEEHWSTYERQGTNMTG